MQTRRQAEAPEMTFRLWRAAAEQDSTGDAESRWGGQWQGRPAAERQARRWLAQDDHRLDAVWLESIEIPVAAIERHELSA